MADLVGTSAAKRRRERRLRSWWRHEAQSVRAAVTTVLHHSCDVGRETYNVLRHQKMTTAREEVVDVTHSSLRAQKTPPPGARPGYLTDPEPQRSDRSQRRFAVDALPTLALPSLAESAAEAPSRSSSDRTWRCRRRRTRRRRGGRRKAKLAKEKEEAEVVVSAACPAVLLKMSMPSRHGTWALCSGLAVSLHDASGWLPSRGWVGGWVGGGRRGIPPPHVGCLFSPGSLLRLWSFFCTSLV